MSNPKYQLMQHDGPDHSEIVDLVCISCGKRRPTTIHPLVDPVGGVYRPHTTAKFTKGLLGPRPGSWLGCKLGSHDFYFEYEVEAVS